MQRLSVEAIPRKWEGLHFLSGLAEALLVELLELGVGAAEITARRRDALMTGKALREGHADLLGPLGHGGVAKPVRRDALGQARALRGVGHDRLRHLHAHPVRAVALLPPRDEECRVAILPAAQIALDPAPRLHAQE